MFKKKINIFKQDSSTNESMFQGVGLSYAIRVAMMSCIGLLLNSDAGAPACLWRFSVAGRSEAESELSLLDLCYRGHAAIGGKFSDSGQPFSPVVALLVKVL